MTLLFMSELCVVPGHILLICHGNECPSPGHFDVTFGVTSETCVIIYDALCNIV